MDGKPFILLSFVLSVLSTPAAHAARACNELRKPPIKVTVNLTVEDTKYDFNKTSRELTESRREQIVEWLQKHGVKSVGWARHMGQLMKVYGVASGGYDGQYAYRMQAQHVDRYGVYYCPYLQHIHIELVYKTVIFIPEDIKQGSCEFKEIMKHEWKHHTANLIAVKKYAKRLEQDLPLMARHIENRIGYVDRSQVDRKFKEIEQAVEDAVDIYMETLYADSYRRNENIDTPQEYLRVERAIEACEKERKK